MTEAIVPETPQTPLWLLKVTQLLLSAAAAVLVRFIQVFYSELGWDGRHIGVLQVVSSISGFVGQLFWASIIDRIGDFKRPLVGTSAAGAAVVCLNMVPFVQKTFWVLLLVTALWSFLLAPGGPIIDAMSLTVLADRGVTKEGYGDQRLWCAIGWGGMSLITGQFLDTLGFPFMFLGFVAISCLNIGICVIWLPSSKRQEDSKGALSKVDAIVLNFELVWFFANIVLYGIAMSLHETFFLVFLRTEFVNTTKLLCGASVAMMCLFEIPVFMYAERLWTNDAIGLTTVMVACQLILALRCWLYLTIPHDQPWLVLLVEPLHGLTFGGMWVATVEYGRRIAPRGAVARMQALVNGVFYQVALGIGSLLWGALQLSPPRGIGFRSCFIADMCLIVAWCVVWTSGVALCLRGSRQATEGKERLLRR
eukprot:TRINITY_DN74377_c0_g1_i1.p1 TRINITY_DN74377_c0_g1~~TRINITY_DN74377_c0_g1_i1.p1  ORF type:complete len:422 (+),score=62.30 TRINITY_DN74377_c0_g1_i1:129-1394(+)